MPQPTTSDSWGDVPFRIIQLDALWAVLDGSVDYHVRRILRWYSKEFSTPLHLAEALPLESVLQAYFEVQAEHHQEQKTIDEYAAKITERPEERYKREVADEARREGDETFLEQLKAHAKALEESKKTKLQAPASQLQAPLPEPKDDDEIEMVFAGLVD